MISLLKLNVEEEKNWAALNSFIDLKELNEEKLLKFLWAQHNCQSHLVEMLNNDELKKGNITWKLSKTTMEDRKTR